MEKLSAEQLAEINKMSTERLVVKLNKAGYDEETILALDRPQLKELWGKCVAEGKDKPPASAVATGGVVDHSIEQFKIQMEMMRMQLEEDRRRYEEEKAERRRKEEEEKEERRRKDDLERMRLEAEQRRWFEEKEAREAQTRVDQDLKQRELAIREQELERLREKDKQEEERRTMLTSRTKQYFDVFKGLLHKLPNDPAEVIGYFEHLESLFELYQVPEDVQPKILQAHLNEKAKSLTVRLTKDQLADYGQFKEFLLNEYRITPTQLRERFFSLNKKADETYVNLSSKLHNAWMYYVRSRNVDDFYQMVSLICADRLKDLIPRSCLDWILSQEDTKKGTWLDHQELATAADTYMASHFPDGKPKFSSTAPQFRRFENRNFTANKAEKANAEVATASPVKTENKSAPRGGETPRKCYNCNATGHIARNCPKQKDGAENKKPTRVSACAVDSNASTVVAPVAVVQHKVEPTSSVQIARTSARSISEENTFADVGKSDNAPCSNANDCLVTNCSEHCNCISAEQYYDRNYCTVKIEGLNDPIKALVDGGSMHCVISEDLVKHLSLPVVKQVHLSGLQGQADIVNVVRLHVNPVTDSSTSVVNIAPSVKCFFAVLPNSNEKCIITPSVFELLKTVASYDVISPSKQDRPNEPIHVDRSMEQADMNVINNDSFGDVIVDTNCVIYKLPDKVIAESDTSMASDRQHNSYTDIVSTTVDAAAAVDNDDDDASIDFIDTDNANRPRPSERVATAEVLAEEQKNCPTLQECWKLAERNKGNFFVEDGLLFHRDVILGHRVKQLVLPEGSRRRIVMEAAHDAPFAGHMAWRRTRYRARLAFYWPSIDDDIRRWCFTCEICQKNKPVRVADRVPITPIPRDEELPFSNLVIDCIGPIVPEGDATTIKPEYNYALVIVDRYSRYPMAYPLKKLTAKAVCDCLLNVFMTYSIPKVISSDCGSNFTSQLTREFLKRLGCSPRFNTPGHPEASGLVERANSSIKTAIFKLCQGDPRGWHRLLPFVVWSLREVPNSTTHVSPHTLVFGTLPRGPLTVLKESWAGERELPFSIGKKPEEYLQTLKENLEIAKAYADIHAQKEQKRYADHYNLRSTDRKYQLGDKVVVLAPVVSSGRKYYSRWQGPGIVTEVKSPYSYVVEVDGKKRHLHANKIRKFHERIEQAVVNNCSVIFDKDEDFGSVEVVETNPPLNVEKLPSQRIDPAKVAHLSDTQKHQLFAVLDKFATVFSDKPGFYPHVEHEIKITQDFKPKRLRAYRVPELLKSDVDREIKSMLELGIIRPSSSEMASPVVCVLKGPNGENGVRIAIDFRYVNKYSLGDSYPTPDISDVLQKVSRANFISTFDAKSGYWQIPMKKESQWLTCFVCSSGLYEFVRMPFGLKSASNTFIRAISRILEPINDFTESFVDDMAVLSYSWEQHLAHVDQYLQKIQESGLTLGLKKCSFGQPKAKFVGHVVGSGLIEPDPVKLATIPNIQAPATKTEVRKLMGFFSYFRSFVPSFAETARILTDLTHKHMPNKVRWEVKHQQALDKLKSDLQEAVKHPLHSVDFGKDFGLLVDASATAVGCCLIQWNDDGSEKPISFSSTKLSPTQSRWATIEREAFAVISGLKKYRSWIFRAKVIVFSDHNPLTYLTEAAPKSAKLARWALALQEFNLEFRYRAGNKNAAADFLSRL